MTVSDLIAKLQRMPLDALVVTPGFDEEGYDTVETVKQIEVVQVSDEPGDNPLYDRYPECPMKKAPIRSPQSAVVINW